MADSGLTESFRRYVACIGVAGVGGVFYGMIAGGIAREFTDITENDALLFVVLPVALLFIALMWRKLPRILGFDTGSNSDF